MNNLGRALISGRMLVTAECLPPSGSDTDDFRELFSSLPPMLDAVVVSDNPDRIRSSALPTAAMLRRETGLNVIMSMTSRDRNRIALMSDALGAAALDIAGILCVSGNHQSSGICPEAAAANDLDAVQLTLSLKKMVLYGTGLNGRIIEPGITLQVGACAHPFMRPMGLNLLCHKKKITVGADFLLTRAVFDPDGFAEWMDAVRAADLDKRTAIIAGVLPLPGVEKARELQRSRTCGTIPEELVTRIAAAADPVKEGIAIAAETANRLKQLPGVRGIHILSCVDESSVAAVIQKAGW
jgi:methylenetetrahydrofolate reductase (NADPH)